MNRRGFFGMLIGLVASFFGVKALPRKPVIYGYGIPYWLVRESPKERLKRLVIKEALLWHPGRAVTIIERDGRWYIHVGEKKSYG